MRGWRSASVSRCLRTIVKAISDRGSRLGATPRPPQPTPLLSRDRERVRPIDLHAFASAAAAASFARVPRLRPSQESCPRKCPFGFELSLYLCTARFRCREAGMRFKSFGRGWKTGQYRAIQSKGTRPSNNLKGLHPAALELHLYL